MKENLDYNVEDLEKLYFLLYLSYILVRIGFTNKHLIVFYINTRLLAVLGPVWEIVQI